MVVQNAAKQITEQNSQRETFRETFRPTVIRSFCVSSVPVGSVHEFSLTTLQISLLPVLATRVCGFHRHTADAI